MKGSHAVLFALVVLAVFLSGCPLEEDTADVPGPLDKFDPIASLVAVAAFAGKEALLEEIYAEYVRPDGTLNLQAEYRPHVRYGFFGKFPAAQAEPEKREPDTPLGVRQTNRPKEVKPYRDHIAVYIRSPHWESYILNGEETQTWNGGMERVFAGRVENQEEIANKEAEYRNRGAPLSFAQIWRGAIEAGAPADNVVAIIHYRDGEYRFYIDGTTYEFFFDGTGKLIKK